MLIENLFMIKKWKLLKVEKNVCNLKRMPIDQHVFVRPDGEIVSWNVRANIGKVIVFGLTRRNEVILIKQFRHGINKIDLGLPAGGIGGHGTPLQYAKRELHEEAAYTSKKWIKLGVYATSAGNSQSRQHTFLALDCDFIGQKLEDNEFIDVELVSLSKFKSVFKSGRMNDVGCVFGTYLALDYLREKKKLRK